MPPETRRREILKLLRDTHPRYLDFEQLASRLRLEESMLEEELRQLRLRGLIEEEGRKTRITSRGIGELAEEERRELMGELKRIAEARRELEEKERLLQYKFWGWALENLDKVRGELDDPRLSARYRLLLKAMELSIGVERAEEGERSVEELLQSFNELAEELRELSEHKKLGEFPKLIPLSPGKEPRTYGVYMWKTDGPLLDLMRFWLDRILTFLLLELG
ncbi:MAG: hypothetical protein QXM46_03505 [Candidatus Hadarchaeales archaeon]